MSELTARMKTQLNKTVLEPQLIVEIEGLPLFSVRQVYKVPRFDDPGLYFDMPGFNFDQTIEDKNSHALIDLKLSTQIITQQVFQDKGIASSVSSVTVCLVDKDGLLTKFISPGVVVDDILSRKATVYLNFGKGAHPEDSFPVLYGVIDTITSGAGQVKLKISHPDGLKRQEIFTNIQTSLAERLRYRSKRINGVNYQTQDRVAGSATVSIISGGTKGSEEVTVVGNAVTVKANTTAALPADRSTAGQVVSAIRKVQAAVDIIDADTVEDMDGTVQSAFGATTLDSDTEIILTSVAGLLLPSDDGTCITYVRLGDEIIRYTGIVDRKLVGITRGQFGTIPQTFDADEDCTSFYRLVGSMKEIALKMMLSGGKAVSEIPAYSFCYIDAANAIDNAIVFTNVDVSEKYGVSVGDFVDSEGDTQTENNFAGRKILSIQVNELGSYIIVDGAPLILVDETSALISFRSKYDVWPDGLGMQVDQVDVKRHEELVDLFPTDFHDYDFYLKDTIKGDQFIEQEVYRPSGCFGIPRRGRSSIGMTMPPLAQADTVVLDETNIVNPSKIEVIRGFTDNFYNSVVFRYELDALEDDLTRGTVTLSQASVDRVPNVKNIPYKIDAKGVRDTAQSRAVNEVQTKRILDRYQFGAELIPEVEVLFKDGFNIEVGSTVIFGSEKLQISDATNGTRKFKPRVMEVKNVKKDIAQGRVFLTLLNTNFSVGAKYGIVAPSSYLAEGSSTSTLVLDRSFGTEITQLENYKWQKYVGQKVIVRTEDWEEEHITVFRGFDQSDPNKMIINPPLSVAPGTGWIVETPPYPDSTDPTDSYLWKAIHVFFNPQVKVVSAPAPNQLEVDPADVAKFTLQSPVEIHSEDFSRWSGELNIVVKAITGTVLTLSRDLDFNAEEGDLIDLIGFKDGGAPYRML